MSDNTDAGSPRLFEPVALGRYTCRTASRWRR